MKKQVIILLIILSILLFSCEEFGIQPRENFYDPDSESYDETMLDHDPPAPGTALSFTPGTSGITLSWTNPADEDFTGVIILRSAAALSWEPTAETTYTGGTEAVSGVSILHIGTGTSYTDTSAPTDTLLYYTVIAYDDVFNYAPPLSGTSYLEGPNTIVDLAAGSIQTLLEGTELFGVRVTLENNGNTDRDITYTLFLSSDTIISELNDQLIFEETMQVDKGRSRIIDLGLETDIHPYLRDAGISLDAGSYYIGVKVDRTDDVSEDDETNNEAVSSTAETFEAVYLNGTITFEIVNADDDYEGKQVYFGIYILDADPADGHEAGGGFSLLSGGGSFTAVFADDDEVVWTGLGGEAYEIYWMIDVNENLDLENPTGPDTGDITGDILVIDLLDGDTTVTLDFNETPAIPNDSVVASLDFPEVAGNTVLFFLFETADEELMSSGNPESWVKATGEAVIDSEGQASVILRQGWPPTDDAAVFYPVEGTQYNLMTGIDVNGNLFEIPDNPYNDPYDYSDIGFQSDMGDSVTRFTGGDSDRFTFTASSYTVIKGLIVDAGGTQGPLGDPDLLLNIIRGGETDPEGTATIAAGDTDGLAVIEMLDEQSNPEGHAWSPESSATYTLQVTADIDNSGDLSFGDLFTEYGITFADADIPMTHYLNEEDFKYYIDSTAGFYSETSGHESPFNFDPGMQNGSFDTVYTGITPWDGTDSIQAQFHTDSFTEVSWFHFDFDHKVHFTDAIPSINFCLNITDAPEITSLDYMIWDDTGAGDSINILEPSFRVSGPDANGWAEYSVPLLGDGDVTLDRSNITSFKFGAPNNGEGYYPCTIYFDDIYFGDDRSSTVPDHRYVMNWGGDFNANDDNTGVTLVNSAGSVIETSWQAMISHGASTPVTATMSSTPGLFGNTMMSFTHDGSDWGGCFVNFNSNYDITAASEILVAIRGDSGSAVYLGVKVHSGDPAAAEQELNLFNYPVTENAVDGASNSWDIYTIPFSAFTAINFTYFKVLGLWNPGTTDNVTDPSPYTAVNLYIDIAFN